MRRLAFALGFGLAFGLATLSSPAQARPPADLALFTILNGEGWRWVMPDAGASGFYGTGRQCIPVAKGGVYKVTANPIAANPTGAYLCHGQLDYWDGGCLATSLVTELNGATHHVSEWAPYYFVASDTALVTNNPTNPPAGLPAAWLGSNTTDRLLCAISDDGGTLNATVVRMW